MSSNTRGRTALVLTFVASLVAIPILISTMLSSWESMVEARKLHLAAPVVASEPHVVSIEALEPLPEFVPPPNTELPIPAVVMGLLEVDMTTLRADDFDAALPYRLAAQIVDGTVVGATVDLQRDGTIDEYWTLRPTLGREVVENGVRRRWVQRDGAWGPE